MVRLKPENGEHEDLIIPAENVKVQGRVVWVFHRPAGESIFAFKGGFARTGQRVGLRAMLKESLKLYRRPHLAIPEDKEEEP